MNSSAPQNGVPGDRLLIASYIYPHHSLSSGYGHLCNHLPGTKLLSTEMPMHEADEGSLRWRISRKLFDLRILRESRRADVLHLLYAENHPSLLFSALKRSNPRLKLIGTFHLPVGYRSVENSLAALRHFDGIIALTSSQADEIRRLMPGKKVWFIPHGGSFENARRDPDAFLGNPFCDIVTVGSNYRDWMCYGQILKLARPHFPRWRFHLVGGGERGVFWFGKDPDTTTHARLSEEEYFKLLNGARALLLPLKFASANNALLEAHSVGLPSVCTDLPGVHDYSVGTTSFFMDAAGAISRLEKLAALDDASTKALRAQTLEEGRRFDWRNVAGDIARIYKELVRSSP